MDFDICACTYKCMEVCHRVVTQVRVNRSPACVKTRTDHMAKPSRHDDLTKPQGVHQSPTCHHRPPTEILATTIQRLFDSLSPASEALIAHWTYPRGGNTVFDKAEQRSTLLNRQGCPGWWSPWFLRWMHGHGISTLALGCRIFMADRILASSCPHSLLSFSLS